jgi:hypothetical protein
MEEEIKYNECKNRSEKFQKIGIMESIGCGGSI